MEISFLIVTRNRPEELRLTLHKLQGFIKTSIHEVLVFIDACTDTESLITDFDWVKWTVSDLQMSASPARALLYKKAVGSIFIGLDDDAHPIGSDFVKKVLSRFRESEKTGILAFQEIRGLFETDQEALELSKEGKNYFTNDFVGCGFAIRKQAYESTQGFPVWVDIYGEEPAVALEVMDAGWDILYCYDLKVNHRVDIEKRKQAGRNYFRFEHQLRNSLRFYMIYYKNPTIKILKLLLHNFKKYALKDVNYFTAYCQVILKTVWNLSEILRYRKPVSSSTIYKRNHIKSITY